MSFAVVPMTALFHLLSVPLIFLNPFLFTSLNDFKVGGEQFCLMISLFFFQRLISGETLTVGAASALLSGFAVCES